MQAKPGRQRKTQTLTHSFTPPTEPANLTAEQKQVWQEIISNPYLTSTDASLVLEFMNLVVLRDTAFGDLLTKGLMIDDAKKSEKTNPSYKIWRDSADRINRLRDALLMTPKSRLAVQAAFQQIEDEPELEDWDS